MAIDSDALTTRQVVVSTRPRGHLTCSPDREMTGMSRLRSLALVTSTACLSLACWTDPQVVWSPDGHRAAVVGRDGLHLTDAEGSLSPSLAAGVTRAVWFADSQRLALVVRREVADFSSLAAVLGPERTQTLVDAAEIIWQQAQAPLDPMDLGDRIMLLTGLGHGVLFSDESDVLTALAWYLREQYADATPPEFTEEDLNPITLNVLVVANLVADRLEIGAVLHADLGRFLGIRPAPGGSAVAFVTEGLIGMRAGVLTTYLASADGTTPARIVATPTAGYPDWSPDGRSLWYVEARDLDDPESDIGWLTEHEVLDSDGELNPAEDASRRVTVRFSTENRVRFLASGVVMFNGRELHVPALRPARPAPDHDQLFAFDPARATLTTLLPAEQLARLPRSLAAFEPGPDPALVLIGGNDGAVLLVSIPDGRVEAFATGFAERVRIPMPSWRQPGEFAYVRRTASFIELVLRRGDTERVLSTGWPTDVLTIKPTYHPDVGVPKPTDHAWPAASSAECF